MRNKKILSLVLTICIMLAMAGIMPNRVYAATATLKVSGEELFKGRRNYLTIELNNNDMRIAGVEVFVAFDTDAFSVNNVTSLLPDTWKLERKEETVPEYRAGVHCMIYDSSRTGITDANKSMIQISLDDKNAQVGKEYSFDITIIDVCDENGNSIKSSVSAESCKINCVLISDDVKIEGFQIKTNNRLNYNNEEYDMKGVAYRTICRAPQKGNEIEIAGENYTVQDMGTIYLPDVSGDRYSGSDMYLNLEGGVIEERKDTGDYQYTVKYYKGYNNLAYGYIASDIGVLLSGVNEGENDTLYVRTLVTSPDFCENNEAAYYQFMITKMHIRAFVVAKDSDGKDVIIYGKNTENVSIAEIADYIYKNSMASNFQGHKFLYEQILNRIDSSNPYYRAEMVSYGWNDNLYTPDTPTATYPTVIEKGDSEAATDVSLNKHVMTNTISATATPAKEAEGPKKLFEESIVLQKRYNLFHLEFNGK